MLCKTEQRCVLRLDVECVFKFRVEGCGFAIPGSGFVRGGGVEDILHGIGIMNYVCVCPYKYSLSIMIV